MIKLSANDHTQGFADQLRAMSDWECTEFVVSGCVPIEKGENFEFRNSSGKINYG